MLQRPLWYVLCLSYILSIVIILFRLFTYRPPGISLIFIRDRKSHRRKRHGVRKFSTENKTQSAWKRKYRIIAIDKAHKYSKCFFDTLRSKAIELGTTILMKRNHFSFGMFYWTWRCVDCVKLIRFRIKSPWCWLNSYCRFSTFESILSLSLLLPLWVSVCHEIL